MDEEKSEFTASIEFQSSQKTSQKTSNQKIGSENVPEKNPLKIELEPATHSRTTPTHQAKDSSSHLPFKSKRVALETLNDPTDSGIRPSRTNSPAPSDRKLTSADQLLPRPHQEAEHQKSNSNLLTYILLRKKKGKSHPKNETGRRTCGDKTTPIGEETSHRPGKSHLFLNRLKSPGENMATARSVQLCHARIPQEGGAL